MDKLKMIQTTNQYSIYSYYLLFGMTCNSHQSWFRGLARPLAFNFSRQILCAQFWSPSNSANAQWFATWCSGELRVEPLRLGTWEAPNPDSATSQKLWVCGETTSISKNWRENFHIWKFPKMRVSPNHPIFVGFSQISILGTPIYENSQSPK